MTTERRPIVIDASLAINFALPGQPYHSQAVGLFQQWAIEGIRLAAPPLYESEVDSVIRRYVFRSVLDTVAGNAALLLLDALPVAIIHDTKVRQRAREIAVAFRQDRTYDATYSALAELMSGEFWTADREFQEAVDGHLPYVHFVGEANIGH